MQYTSGRFPTFPFEFGRVSVILGANGSGKSRLLTEIKDNAHTLTGGARAAYIEGGRTIKIKDVLQLDHTNVNQYDRLESALAHYYNKRSTSLADRVFDALVVLDKRDAQLKSQHSDAVDRWLSEGQAGECPKRTQPPLDRFFELFSEIFPLIVLSYDRESRRLAATKNGQAYGPSGLSDGEKQVFSILADLIELDESHKLIVADEPELNLHPELAERVWTLIEDEFPEKTFLYATHSISFALRANVQKVWVLSSNAESIAEFSGLDSLPRAEVAPFLGGLPGILSANRVLVTEGHEKSFDAIFYRWLLQDNKVEIFPAGGCADVLAIVNKSGLWDKISSKIDLRGVVDSDYRDDEDLSSMRSTAVHVLEYHEAEAYLCEPAVICAVASRIGSQELQLEPEQVLDVLLGTLNTQKLVIAARRVFAKARISLAVSVERKLLSVAATKETLISQMKAAAQDEMKKAEVVIAPEQIEQLFLAELTKIEAVMDAKDAAKALRFLAAKEVLQVLAPKAGCRNGTDVMRSLRHNFSPSDFPSTKRLAASLQSKA